MLQALGDFADAAPEFPLTMEAWRPGASDRSVPDGLSDAGGFAYQRLMKALRTLDGTSALQWDIPNDVRETLRLRGSGDRFRLDVVNGLGARERVTSWFAVPGFEQSFDAWNESRRLSEDLGDAWDLSRRERRVVDYFGEAALIDSGVLLILDGISAMGCTTLHSCEGHPDGGYVSYAGERPARVTELLRSTGWGIEPEMDHIVARMPRSIITVQARDRILRATADALLREVPDLAPSGHEMSP